MLRKLLKYDFKETGRLLLPILGGILLLSIIGKIFLETNVYTALPDVLQVLGLIVYIVIIFACSIGVPIYFIISFYRNFYSNRGYVTHTLPVTTNQKLISKIFTSYVFEILSFAVCFVSIIILVYQKGMFKKIIEFYPSFNTQFKAMMDMNFPTFFISTALLMVISMLVQQLMFFASVCIGQIFKSHKVLGMIAGYIILNVATQIIASIVLLLTGFTEIAGDAIPTAQSILALYGVSGCLTLLQGAVFYIICYYFMEKKLNLN